MAAFREIGIDQPTTHKERRAIFGFCVGISSILLGIYRGRLGMVGRDGTRFPIGPGATPMAIVGATGGRIGVGGCCNCG